MQGKLLLSLLISVPVRLPRHADLLMEGTQKHPLNKIMVLAPAVISGKHWRIKHFQRMLDSFYSHPGGTQWVNKMTLPGKTVSFGVINTIKCAIEITEKELMSYLFYIFKKGKAYSTVNTHKVGLLKLYLCDNKWNHNSTILTKFMKGLFNTTIFTKI